MAHTLRLRGRGGGLGGIGGIGGGGDGGLGGRGGGRAGGWGGSGGVGMWHVIIGSMDAPPRHVETLAETVGAAFSSSRSENDDGPCWASTAVLETSDTSDSWHSTP